MKRNAIMQECRKLITPEIKRSMDYSIFVANRIFDILEKQGKSQRDLANALGKSETEISKWLQGTHTFTTKTIAKIDIALGESIFDISNKPKQDYNMFINISANASNQILANERLASVVTLGDDWQSIPQGMSEMCCEMKH